MPFSKGDPNINRKGRPKKGNSFAEILRQVGEEEVQGMSKTEAISRKLWAEASKGEAWAIREIMDRIDGKPTQKVESTVDNTINVQHEVIDGPSD